MSVFKALRDFYFRTFAFEMDMLKLLAGYKYDPLKLLIFLYLKKTWMVLNVQQSRGRVIWQVQYHPKYNFLFIEI